MDMNDETSLLDFGIWNERDELWCIRWMRWKWLSKFVTSYEKSMDTQIFTLTLQKLSYN